MENSLKLSPTLLITMADNECQILKHSNQWVETIDPSVVAMQANLHNKKTDTTSLLETVVANLTKLTTPPINGTRGGHPYSGSNDGGRRYQYDSPDYGYMTLQERVPSNEHTEGESGVFAQNAGEMVNGSVPILMTPISLQNFLPENASMGMIITIGIILLEMAI